MSLYWLLSAAAAAAAAAATAALAASTEGSAGAGGGGGEPSASVFKPDILKLFIGTGILLERLNLAPPDPDAMLESLLLRPLDLRLAGLYETPRS